MNKLWINGHVSAGSPLWIVKDMTVKHPLSLVQ